MKETCNHHHHSEDSCGANHSCVSLVPIFNHLEKEQMKEIIMAIRPLSFKKGELVYKAGDMSDSLYIVSKGRVRIYRLSESGKEQLVRFLNPGDFTGELALFNVGQHESFAEAAQDTEICMMRRSDLQELLVKYPSISLKILEEFSSRLQQSERQATRIATEKAETRLALFLAECADNQQSLEFVLPMSKKDLASYLGITPETVSRKLTDFENQQLIRQKDHKHIEILDLDGLLLV